MQNEAQKNAGAASVPPKPQPTRTGVPTQLDVALEKSAPDPSPLTTRLKLSIFTTDRRVPEPEEMRTKVEIQDEAALVDWIQLAPMADRRDEFALALAGQWESLREQAGENATLLPDSPDCLLSRDAFALVTQEEFLTLRAAEDEMRKAMKDHEPFTVGNATSRWHGERDKHAQALREGRDPGLLPTREAVHHDAVERSRAFNARMAELTHRVVVPIAREVLKRFDVIVEDFLRRTEVRDWDTCEMIGVSHQPSVEWRAAALLWQRHNSPRAAFPLPSSWAYPKALLGGLIQL